MGDQSDVIIAFSEDDVERLTGISVRQLRHWDRTSFFKPSLADDNRSLSYSRVYSFLDLVCLQVLNALRNEAKVPPSHLREVEDKLSRLGEDVWAKTTLRVLNKRVVFYNKEIDQKEEIVSGQGVLQIPSEAVRANMREKVRALWKRDASLIGHIQRSRNVVGNRPVIAGTRIPVAAVKSFADAGYTTEQILGQYPGLTDADVAAALSVAKAA